MPTKFDFLSPGVQLREVDQSQVPETPGNPGILLIGRARSGPAMQPITIRNLNDFEDIFGKPIDGKRQTDPWRDGNTGAPSYAMYGAQAYLAAGVGPVKYVRLLGKSKDGVTAGNNAAGWSMGSTFGGVSSAPKAGERRVSGSACATGLFIVPSGSVTHNTSAQCQIDVLATASILNAEKLTIVSSDGTSCEFTTNLTDVAITNGQWGLSTAGTVDICTQRLLDSINDASSPAFGKITATAPGGVATGKLLLVQTQKGVHGNRTNTDGITGGTTITNFSGGVSNCVVTGTLAAIFYTSGSAMSISGSWVSGSTTAATTSVSSSVLMKGNAANYGITLALTSSGAGAVAGNLQRFNSVNFGGASNANYIRNMCNTDATEFFNNTNYGKTDKRYFLGESFDVNVNRLAGGGGKDDTYFFMAGLGPAGAATYDDFHSELTPAKSGWFIGQRPSMKYLFRLNALLDGEEFQNQFYCRVANLKLGDTLNPRSSFTLQIVKRMGVITKDEVAEEFTNLNLDPNSNNYILKRIGNTRVSWSTSKDAFVSTGLYPNLSNYVWVEMAEDAGISVQDLPTGFLGPRCPATFEINPTTAAANTSGSNWAHGNNKTPMGNNAASFIAGWAKALPVAGPLTAFSNLTASIQWPRFGMTTKDTLPGGASTNYSYDAYFGLRHIKSTSYAHDKSFQDIARRRRTIDPDLSEGAAFSQASFVFTLEDIRSASAGVSSYYWESGSYTKSGDGVSIVKEQSLSYLIKTKKIKRFAAPFFGGADGVDVRYADPFATNQIDNNAGGTSGYPYFTVEQAIDMVSDPEQVEYELISAPGLIKGSLVDKIVNNTTARGDALAIIDVKGIYQAKTDNGGVEQNAALTTFVNTLNTQYIDSSYACTYFPNINLQDTMNGNGETFQCPPSVAGIGAIAQSEASSQPWFAPAGFNRGGLGRLGGNAGPVCVGVVEHLTKDDRDVLYESQVNPIAKFPSTGDFVVFGQKTLQQEASALDRINVRRMMIYLKRKIGAIADTILFDQNVQATWSRFKSQAEVVLSEIQAELGIVDYKLVLDETTTTPDLVDRNIMYAKVFVKPARAIEFIAVDFIITRSGVEF